MSNLPPQLPRAKGPRVPISNWSGLKTVMGVFVIVLLAVTAPIWIWFAPIWLLCLLVIVLG